MNHNNIVMIDELLDKIKKNFTVSKRYIINNSYIKKELNWSITKLFSELIHQSFYTQSIITRKSLEEIKQNLGLSVNIEELFKKNWLREILNEIHISDMINSLKYQFDKVINNKDELQFLLEAEKFFKEKFSENIIPVLDFQQYKKQYEADKNITIDYEFLTINYFIENYSNIFDYVTNSIKINTQHFSGYYYNFYHDFSSFLFIKEVHESISKNDKDNLVINKNLAKQIINKHRILYDETPNIGCFLENKIFIEHDNDNYSFDLKS